MRTLFRSRLHRAAALAMAAAAVQACVGGLGSVDPVSLAPVEPPAITLPQNPDSLRFAAIGDTGTGGMAQHVLAQQMIAAHTRFPFEFVIMMGDNLYGSEGAGDYRRKFEEPYKPLLDAGVKFYASLGNHDDSNQIFYEPFNMGGKEYYSFRPKMGVRFFALDSNYMSPEQLEWLDKELSASGSDWKIAFFHHPMYSTGGRHGSDLRLREELEPRFVKYGVDVVFAGHEHFYERLHPQKGIYHFVSGAGAKLRSGDLEGGPIHAKGFDAGYHFMLIELTDEQMHFQVLSEQGRTVDSGVIDRPPDPPAATASTNR